MPSADVSVLSYEQARDELVAVVNHLEQGSSTLEESIQLWERGEALARRCEEWLIGAKARLDAARGSNTAITDSDHRAQSSEAPRDDTAQAPSE